MQSYKSVEGEHVTSKVIEKSKFITTSAHVEGEEQAKQFIARIASECRDATHNCYAFIADDKGNFLRFSDDGEPQGTAGMPMLEVIKNMGLRQVAVVVTRYFGGIKLGAGGLLRAYSGCVAENLSGAVRVEYRPCVQSDYIVDYSCADAAMRFFGENECSLTDSEYSDRVKFTVAVGADKAQSFDASLVNRLNGRVAIVKIREYLYPFRL